ncbi:glycogen synthase GlgA [Albimonas sp. CAU 1670]|uniref:glycogen synthase GlgA n=1 Tax=Albimonas sp. CAU 1670 TaxID=3032599 RepID=UPI0023DC365B|nr:glycogen synthase GlgA [Albimonas sp. CAU 1670]MDF2231971.1 glycogen synthase GlgA [Albimonas sp. CAU 1670]
MQILSVVSECAPLVKTGGLADVAGALPGALAPLGVRMRTLLPAYPGLAARLSRPRAHAWSTPFGPVRLLEGEAEGLDLILIESPLYDRAGGGPYTGPDRRDWPDNHLRFGLLSWLGAGVAAWGLDGWTADVVHAHDWQAGLAPTYLRLLGPEAPRAVLTIHNIAYQGVFGREALGALTLPEAMFTPEHVEFHGLVGFLKAGLAHAERITTVSPTYARELLTPAFGWGLDGLLRHRAGDLEGILNGIDTGVWDPASDPNLAANYERPKQKAPNRAAVCERFGVAPAEGAPLFCVVSRMTRQKGLDLLIEALPALLEEGAALAVIGSGDEDLEQAYRAAAQAHPGRVGVEIGYDEPASHLLQAGADAILIPSRFEPCGLTQLIGLRYGTAPVVARTGGLADTVVDANAAALRTGVATGFVHAPDDVGDLAEAIRRTCAVHRDPKAWGKLTRNAMAQPVGWDESAQRYAALYRRLAPAAA